WLASDARKAVVAPWNTMRVLGDRPISCCAASMTSTALLSDAPGARLNDTLAAGNCPRWLVTSGALRSLMRAIALSGTWLGAVDVVAWAVVVAAFGASVPLAVT